MGTTITDKARQRELSLRKTRLGRTLRWLILPLLIEGFITLMLHPSWLGNEWTTKVLTQAGEFFRWLLWPRDPQEVDTYRYQIYQVCTWFMDLPVYPLVKTVVPWALPGWFALTMVSWLITKFRMNHKITRPQINMPKAPKTSGLYADDAKAAMDRYFQAAAMCTDAFEGDQGIRIQQIAENGSHHRDYVVRWNENAQILLTELIEGKLLLVLKNGCAFVDTEEGLFPLQKGVPMVLRRLNRGGETIIQSAITWLGDD